VHRRHRRTAGRPPRRSWSLTALQLVKGWLVVSPLLLSTLRVTPGAVSAIAGGLALVVLGAWARVAGNRVPPQLLALAAAALVATRRGKGGSATSTGTGRRFEAADEPG
jgi:membrane protein implicated in regulation of membrane protease activity